MKTQLTISMAMLASLCFGQSKEKLKINIDSIVESITSDKSIQTIQFRIVALKKVFHHLNYNYQTIKGEIVKIERGFSNKEDSTTQTFYLKKGKLIYAIERVVSHYGDDSVVWSGNFYFKNGKLIDLITLGHGKSETESWNPEISLQTAFYESRRDIVRHLKSKNGS